MGNSSSAPEREAGDDYSRDSSPLPGGDEGPDGLPRPYSASSADFHAVYSDPVDGLPTFSSPIQPAKKRKKSRKSDLARLSDMNGDAQHDTEELEDSGVAAEDLELVARNIKSEPESPESTRSKKKRRKKSKAKSSDETEAVRSPPTISSGPLQRLPHIAEEAPTLPVTDLNDEAPVSSIEPSSPRKKKSKSNKAKGPNLDLNEDPIAASEDEVVIPSSDRPSRIRKAHPDDDGSSRKFRKKTPLPAAVQRHALTIEDVLNEEPRADVVEGTQGDAPSEVSGAESGRAGSAFAPNESLRRSRELEQYETGASNTSPSVTRQERRTRLASAVSASVSLAGALATEQPSKSPARSEEPGSLHKEVDGDAMEVDSVEPSQGQGLDRVFPEERRETASDYSGDLDDHNEDEALDKEPELPRTNQQNGSKRPGPETDDFMSTLDDNALVALVSTQPEPPTDDNRSRSERSSAEDIEQREDLFSNTSVNDNAARSRSTVSSAESSRQRDTHAKETPEEPQTSLQLALSGSKGDVGANASGVPPVSEAGSEVENRRRPGLARLDIRNLLVDRSSPVNSDDHDARVAGLGGGPLSPERLSAARTPRVGQNSANPSPRSSRTYKRQPKPTFFERNEESAVQAFAELPSNEVVATPKPKKSRAKRRLPIDVPDADGQPSSSAPKRKRTSVGKAPRAPRYSEDSAAVQGSRGYLSGAFTKSEAEKVEAAVESIRLENGMTQYEVNAMIQQNPKDPDIRDNTIHERLWARVVEACPTRPRQRLINWCRQKFHNFVARGTWTPEQDEELREMVRQHGTKWNVIGQLINRYQKDVRDRWRNYLVAGDNQVKNRWSEEEEKQFLEIVGEVLSVFQAEREANPDSEMFSSGKTNDELIDWNVVAERMNFIRTRLQCQEKWRRMREANKVNETELAAHIEPDQHWRLRRARQEISSMSHADMYHIVRAISQTAATAPDDAHIDWKAVVARQAKRFHRYTAILLWSRLRQLVPDEETKSLRECAKELISMYQTDGGTFALPGNEAYDEAQEEDLLADIPRRSRGPAKPKTPIPKRLRPLAPAPARAPASTPRRVVSEPFIVESDSEDGEGADDGDSSRANYNATSPAREPASGEEEQGQDGRDSAGRDNDEVSLDLANDDGAAEATAPTTTGRNDRAGSVDLSNDGPEADAQEETAEPQRGRRKTGKRKQAPAADAADAGPERRLRKRYSGEMMLDLRSQTTTSDGAAFTPVNKPARTAGRKRPRADTAAATATPNGTAEAQGSSSGRKHKRAKRGEEEPVEETVGSDTDGDDMSDIPARMPVRR